MFCSTMEFMKEQNKAHFSLAITLKQVQEGEKRNSIPLEIQYLLKEFEEIVANDFVEI